MGLLEEEIESLMESNKKLLEKVNAVADVVAQGIRKAASLKNTKLVMSHREETDNSELRTKRRNLLRIQGAIVKCKRRIKTLETELSIISR